MAPSNRKELDSLVLSIELTLISIIQGVALYFLTENSRGILVELKYQYWPYALTGLLTLLLFWSRSILHALTVIRWPLEFGHNFLYISATLVEAVAFTQVGNPQSWFVCNAGLSVMIWILFCWDLRLVRRPPDEGGGRGEAEEMVYREQMQNIRILMPMTFFFNVLCAYFIYHWPDFFIAQRGHLILICGQMVAALIYLLHSLGFYRKLTPYLTREREE